MSPSTHAAGPRRAARLPAVAVRPAPGRRRSVAGTVVIGRGDGGPAVMVQACSGRLTLAVRPGPDGRGRVPRRTRRPGALRMETVCGNVAIADSGPNGAAARRSRRARAAHYRGTRMAPA